MFLLTLSGCKPAANPVPPPPIRTSVSLNLERYAARSVGRPVEGKPWITHVNVADLNGDGRQDILACDATMNAIVWLRSTASGEFTESTLMSGLPAPVHVEPADMDGDGDIDLLVACMGEVLPNDDQIGSVIILENDGSQHFTKHVVAERVARVTDVRAGDLDGDGRLDLAVAQFGYIRGEVRWMRNLGDWRFESRILLNLSGAINVGIADLNGDRSPDIVALFSQQWEEIHLFENDGKGNFTDRIIFGSSNEDFGSSGLSLCDLNRDGRPDLLYTNGDGMDYAEPGRRPWHGLQWLENVGSGNFRYHRIGDLPGAFSPVGVDLENRGTTDIVCVSTYNDWSKPDAASLVVFRNDGSANFTMQVLAHAPIRLVTCAVGNLDNSARPSFVTGGFNAYPPFDRMSRLTLWHPQP